MTKHGNVVRHQATPLANFVNDPGSPRFVTCAVTNYPIRKAALTPDMVEHIKKAYCADIDAAYLFYIRTPYAK